MHQSEQTVGSPTFVTPNYEKVIVCIILLHWGGGGGGGGGGGRERLEDERTKIGDQ